MKLQLRVELSLNCGSKMTCIWCDRGRPVQTDKCLSDEDGNKQLFLFFMTLSPKEQQEASLCSISLQSGIM